MKHLTTTNYKHKSETKAHSILRIRVECYRVPTDEFTGRWGWSCGKSPHVRRLITEGQSGSRVKTQGFKGLWVFTSARTVFILVARSLWTEID